MSAAKPGVTPENLPYGRQWITDADVEAVAEVLRSDWLTTGPKIAEFEEAFAKTVGAGFAVAVCNGTAALHAAAYAAGISEGDEAVVPPMTFAASANCVRYQGGTVVFADVRPDTLSLDPTLARAAMTERTKAIITVDYTGQPSDLDELMALAEEKKCVVIEDAAHALGASYKGRPIGSIAHMTTFSLHPVKQITTGEGGVITTNDPELASRLRLFRNHGITTDHRQREAHGSWFYEMADLGYNYRITDFQCALGLSQLGRLGSWIERRTEIARRYDEAFSGLAAVEPLTVLPDRKSAWHLYVIRLKLELLRGDRADMFRSMREEKIGVNVHYIPVHWHPYYQRLGYRKGAYPVAEQAYERLLSLPMFPAMTDADVERVIDAVTTRVARLAR